MKWPDAEQSQPVPRGCLFPSNRSHTPTTGAAPRAPLRPPVPMPPWAARHAPARPGALHGLSCVTRRSFLGHGHGGGVTTGAYAWHSPFIFLSFPWTRWLRRRPGYLLARIKSRTHAPTCHICLTIAEKYYTENLLSFARIYLSISTTTCFLAVARKVCAPLTFVPGAVKSHGTAGHAPPVPSPPPRNPPTPHPPGPTPTERSKHPVAPTLHPPHQRPRLQSDLSMAVESMDRAQGRAPRCPVSEAAHPGLHATRHRRSPPSTSRYDPRGAVAHPPVRSPSTGAPSHHLSPY